MSRASETEGGMVRDGIHYPPLPVSLTDWPEVYSAKQVHDYAETVATAAVDSVRGEVLRELLDWEAHYHQQARGGDQSGRSDARADAAREIHDHLRHSWGTRAKAEQRKNDDERNRPDRDEA